MLGKAEDTDQLSPAKDDNAAEYKTYCKYITDSWWFGYICNCIMIQNNMQYKSRDKFLGEIIQNQRRQRVSRKLCRIERFFKRVRV